MVAEEGADGEGPPPAAAAAAAAGAAVQSPSETAAAKAEFSAADAEPKVGLRHGVRA